MVGTTLEGETSSCIGQRFYLVYNITNTLNGMIYVGIRTTCNVNDGYLGSGVRIKNAVARYGRAAFTKEILFYCNDHKEMVSREREIVTPEFVLRADTYNLVVGGSGNTGFKTPEGVSFGRLGSNKHQQLLLDTEYRAKYSENLSRAISRLNSRHWVGRRHRDETKQKMRESRAKLDISGQNNPAFGTCWVHKEGITKKIAKHELSDYENSGWLRGRVLIKK